MSTLPNFRPVATPLPASDADLATLNQRLGVPSMISVPASAPVAPRAPAKALNVLLPDYVVRAIKDRAHAEDASLRYVVLTALKGLGIEIAPTDMVEDARRSENKTKAVL